MLCFLEPKETASSAQTEFDGDIQTHGEGRVLIHSMIKAYTVY